MPLDRYFTIDDKKPFLQFVGGAFSLCRSPNLGLVTTSAQFMKTEPNPRHDKLDGALRFQLWRFHTFLLVYPDKMNQPNNQIEAIWISAFCNGVSWTHTRETLDALIQNSPNFYSVNTFHRIPIFEKKNPINCRGRISWFFRVCTYKRGF